MVDGIDIGLNIINMYANLLVPELARIPFADAEVNIKLYLI